ncbi:MAG: hypothetical protein CO114_00995 [Euryarchaeota archaeon CG_4_9_14_3_um_filter_38_12]|jgi:hypothetical protein|nr:MAG: hypothetical protein CO114_00995 [Euryarchaeota archaeon CG_4_9_14_3_um_filter_38_12]
MRTTVELNDAVYKRIVNEYGKRNISKTINELLFGYFFRKKKKDMFGIDPWLKKVGMKDLRDEYERNI